MDHRVSALCAGPVMTPGIVTPRLRGENPYGKDRRAFIGARRAPVRAALRGRALADRPLP